jgi:hypothetical protein
VHDGRNRKWNERSRTLNMPWVAFVTADFPPLAALAVESGSGYGVPTGFSIY